MVDYEVTDNHNTGEISVRWKGYKRAVRIVVGSPGELTHSGHPDAALIRQRRETRRKMWHLLRLLSSDDGKRAREIGIEVALDEVIQVMESRVEERRDGEPLHPNLAGAVREKRKKTRRKKKGEAK